MRKVSCFLLSFLTIALIIYFNIITAPAGDMMPGSVDVKILLDNYEMKVSEATRSPGTIVPMHKHPKFFAYYIDAAKVKLTPPDGKETIRELPNSFVIPRPTPYPDGSGWMPSRKQVFHARPKRSRVPIRRYAPVSR